MLGKYIGCYAILAVSFLAAFGLGLISEDYLRFLGIVPILLGIKAYFEEKSQEDSAHPMREVKSSFVANAAMITIANSADNIGVYIPLFAEYSLPQMLITVIVFTVMTFLWCILGEKIATLAPIQNTIQKYKRIAIPLIYILLGIYILIF
jgi:cadmium resistance protein CadD (predicted permease)